MTETMMLQRDETLGSGQHQRTDQRKTPTVSNPKPPTPASANASNRVEPFYFTMLDHGERGEIALILAVWPEINTSEGSAVLNKTAMCRKRLRITNMPERQNRKTKRRTPIATLFSSAATSLRRSAWR